MAKPAAERYGEMRIMRSYVNYENVCGGNATYVARNEAIDG